jgi:hypothetical protein
MGLLQRRGSSECGRSHGDGFLDRLERDRQLEPRFRYRVVLVGGGEVALGRGSAGRIVWVTNDSGYARALVARINAVAGRECSRVEAWNRADNAAQSRWICVTGPAGGAWATSAAGSPRTAGSKANGSWKS